MQAPIVKKMFSRPKKSRRKEAGETAGTTSRVSRRGMQQKCSRYGQPNHNKRACPLPAPS